MWPGQATAGWYAIRPLADQLHMYAYVHLAPCLYLPCMPTHLTLAEGSLFTL